MLANLINSVVTVSAVLLNGLIITLVIEFIRLVYKPDINILPYLKVFGITKLQPEYMSYLMAGIILTLTITIAFTPIADMIIRFVYSFRRPLADETDKLCRLVSEVCFSAKIDPKDYSFYIVDEDTPNAYALGFNNIGVGRKLLKDFDDNEIKGVIAHEFGHLKNNDNVHTRIFIAVGIIGQGILSLLFFLGNLFNNIAKLPIPAINWGAFLIGLSCFAIQAFIQFILSIPLFLAKMLCSRSSEYRADKYAFELGYGAGLYSFLKRILDTQPQDNHGLLNLLKASHPKTGKRLLKIEKLFELAKQNKPTATLNVVI